MPVFVAFTRTPHVAAFEVPAAAGQSPMCFIAVNAHLIYGKMRERKDEFRALVRWMTMRLKNEKRMVAPNFILLGDLNMDLDRPRKDRREIEDFIDILKAEAFGSSKTRRIYFPFVGDHPVMGRAIRTNARTNQTFDQIAFFRGRNERRLPDDRWRRLIDRGQLDAFDYGVFNFAELFARVVKKKAYLGLTTDERKEFGKSFEHSVSDHMPIWVRIPRPGFHPPPNF